MKHLPLIASLLLASTMLSACSTALDRLDNVGKPPEFTDVKNPQESHDYKPISWPMPEAQPPEKQYANSLWQPGSRAFFRDQRASRAGDILRVNVKIEDKAELDNKTERSRNTRETLATPSVFGLQNKIFKQLPGKQDVTNLADIDGNTSSSGNGNVKRKEKIETQVAAMVTQVLPNGNMVIEGKQEIRVNYEIREVSIKGVVRSQDIRSDNTIDSTQVAEARMTYGGRGQLSDMQQPRWGSQVIEAISPF